MSHTRHLAPTVLTATDMRIYLFALALVACSRGGLETPSTSDSALPACDTIATPLVRSKVSPRRGPARAPGWRTDPRCGAGGRPIPRQQNSSYVEFTAW